jgi:DNA-binding response OmpR family regulator
MAADLKIKSALKSTRVLVAEDDTIMLTLIKDVLAVLGFGEINVVKDGLKAIQEIKLNNYDLVFCDWKMPGVSGIEFTKAVRSLPSYEKSCVPIIMVTGKALEEDVITARDAGVNEYLIKPFSIKLMCTKVKNIIEHPRPFILSQDYRGPDRRRKDDFSQIPGGIDRRNLNDPTIID